MNALFDIDLLEGQSLSITLTRVNDAIKIHINSEPEIFQQKPKRIRNQTIVTGPVKSVELHQTILDALATEPLEITDIRARVAEKFPDADANTVSWAIVELQQEGCKRGRNKPKTGPVTKNEHGLYELRKLC